MTSAPDSTILRLMILAEMPICLIFQENKNHFYQLRRKNNLLMINLWIIKIDRVAFGKMAKGNFPRPAQPLNANINLRYAGIHTKLKFRAADSGKFRWSSNFSFPRNYEMNKKTWMHSTNRELLLMTIGSIAGCCSGKKSSGRLNSIEWVFDPHSWWKRVK